MVAGLINKSSINGRPLIKPKALNMGSRIGLIAPGSPVPEERIARAIETVQHMGWQPVLGRHIYEEKGYLAGSDEMRLQDLHSMYQDKSIDGIWCLRGGYGCTRLLSRIDYDMIRKNAKPLMGYSDITALHIAIHREANVIGYHSPVAASKRTEYTMHSLRQVMFGEKKVKIHNLETESHRRYVISAGKASGVLLGGNLSLLVALVGTRWAPSYRNKLVFIEDIGEKPYRIDRMLVQLFQGSDLQQAAGIILGQFNDCEAKANEKSLTLEETLRHQFGSMQVPVYYGFSFGHVDDQCTLPIGIKASFNTTDAKLILEESATYK